MRLGPLIFRVAGWPLEAIRGIASLHLTAMVDEWILESRLIEWDGRRLADEVFLQIPSLADRNARRGALTVRRALYACSSLFSIPASYQPYCKPGIEEHIQRMKRHAAARQELAAEYERALATELNALYKIADEERFQKALCLASPGTYTELIKKGDSVDWRLTRTLLQFLTRAVGRPTPNGLWSGVCLEQGAAGEGIVVETDRRKARFAPRLCYLEPALGDPFPSHYEDAWEALARQSVGSNLISRLKEICARLDATSTELTAERFHAELSLARVIVNERLAEVGAAPVRPDQCVLVADSVAPFRFWVSLQSRQQMAQALLAVWRFDRLGTAKPAAQAQRACGETPDLTTCWEVALNPVYKDSRYCLTDRMSYDPMAPGAALLRLESGGTGIRVGCIAPDPALFYGRFHYLFRDIGQLDFSNWYSAELRRAEHDNPGFRFATVGFDRPSDWNAAARPMFGCEVIEPAEHAYEAGILPLVSSAVSLHTAHPAVRRLADQMHLLGRPSLLRPLPLLPKERAEWKHLPRLELAGNITISPERWLVPNEVVTLAQSLNGLDRYITWRSYALSSNLPQSVYVVTGIEATESLLPCNSVLATEVLWRSIGKTRVELRLQEAFPEFANSLVADLEGQHYVFEVAAAWAADEEFWQQHAAELEKTCEVSHVS